MTTDFSQFNLHPQLVQAVTTCGYSVPMPIQTSIIPLMMEGYDVIGQAQTGTGKTAAFALPILHNLQPKTKHIQSLVLAPTRELALQVAEAITEYGAFQKVRVLAIYGGQSYVNQINQLKQGVDIVVGTPGRLLDLIRKKVLDIQHIHTLIIDEADEMLSMGFIEDIETILAETPTERQTALFSATMPPEIRKLAKSFMRDAHWVSIQPEQVSGETIQQRYYLIHKSDKLAALTRLFEAEDISRALIFVRTRVGSGDLANDLTTRGYPAEALNGDLSQDTRERIMNRFRQNQLKVLVATDVAARGLDIDDISHVINYDIPDDVEVYVHRIGRTGRAGKSGIAISLLSPNEKRRFRQIELFTRQTIQRAALPSEQDILARREGQLVQQLSTWLQRGRCRRERELVETLLQEGHDVMDIAAAAIKLARADEKQRPLLPLQEVREKDVAQPARGHKLPRFQETKGDDNRMSKANNYLHEADMVRLNLNLGKKHGIRPKDIVGAIAYHADIPGHVIGKILIQEKSSQIDVPEKYVHQVLNNTKKVLFRRQAVIIQPV